MPGFGKCRLVSFSSLAIPAIRSAFRPVTPSAAGNGITGSRVPTESVAVISSKRHVCMLSEMDKRRPELNERTSVPVVLADGQAWQFPKPWLEIHAVFHDGKANGDTYPVLTCGPELDALVDALGQCEGNDAVLCGAATLGAHLLRRNYDLTDAERDQ